MEQRERDLLGRLVKACCQREGADGRHVERISRYSGLLAEGAGLEDDNIRLIEYAAPLHDIGNISIPDAILQKPGPLTVDERQMMQRHTVLGHDILRDSNSEYIQIGAEIALNHHEHWDGGGYPNGIVGEAIPMSARIAVIADVLDALTSPRPYRAALGMDQALLIVRGGAGKQFDPDLVRILDGREKEVLAIHRSFVSEHGVSV